MINSSISSNSVEHKSFVSTQFKCQTVLFDPFINHRFDLIRCYLSGSDGNETVFCIPQSSSITGPSPSDCLVSSPEHSFWESYLSAEMESVYRKQETQWKWVWLLYGESIDEFYSPSRLGQMQFRVIWWTSLKWGCLSSLLRCSRRFLQL